MTLHIWDVCVILILRNRQVSGTPSRARLGVLLFCVENAPVENVPVENLKRRKI